MSPVCNIRQWAVCVTSAAWIRLWYGFLYLLYPISSASTNCTRAWTGIWKYSTPDNEGPLKLNNKTKTLQSSWCTHRSRAINMHVCFSFFSYVPLLLYFGHFLSYFKRPANKYMFIIIHYYCYFCWSLSQRRIINKWLKILNTYLTDTHVSSYLL